jgi:acyl carrier protein
MRPDDSPLVAAERIESRLRGFIQDELLQSDVFIDPDTDLLSGDLLDSLGALRLASFIGEEFGVTIEPRDLVVENFRSIAALTAFVQRLSVASS